MYWVAIFKAVVMSLKLVIIVMEGARRDDHDIGMHTVCAKITQEFLDYSKANGNDLSTAFPEAEFPGLKPGDRWCLCAQRWIEALEENVAPKIHLQSTHSSVLEYVELEVLVKYALDIN